MKSSGDNLGIRKPPQDVLINAPSDNKKATKRRGRPCGTSKAKKKIVNLSKEKENHVSDDDVGDDDDKDDDDKDDDDNDDDDNDDHYIPNELESESIESDVETESDEFSNENGGMDNLCESNLIFVSFMGFLSHLKCYSFHMFKEGSPSSSADFQETLRLHYNSMIYYEKT